VELVEYDTAGLQHVIDIIALYQVLVVMSIAMLEFPEVVLFCALMMLGLTDVQLMKAKGSVAVLLL